VLSTWCFRGRKRTQSDDFSLVLLLLPSLQDLVAGVEFVKATYPEIDPERTACLGVRFLPFLSFFLL
jgi:hypothetical protein